MGRGRATVMSRLLGLLTLAVVLAGCGGEGGSLSCPAPGTTGCDSLDTVYLRTAGLDAQRLEAEGGIRRLRSVPGSRVPRLRGPEVVRVWIAPWEDADGDLHDQQYVHLVVREARWDVDHHRPLPPAAAGPPVPRGARP